MSQQRKIVTLGRYLAIFLAWVSVSVLASDLTAAVDVTDTVKDSHEEPIQISASDQVREVAEKYRDKKGIEWGASGKGNKIYYFVVKQVEADPNSKSWGKARSLAFEKALLEAQAKFIKDKILMEKLHLSQKD